MRVIDPGHVYEIPALDGGVSQEIYFVKRVGENYPGNTNPTPGPITQEFLRAIIDRCKYMNAQGPCIETAQILAGLRMALYAFEVRAARCRGTYIYLDNLEGIEDIPTCPKCGHIQCDPKRHTEPHWSVNKPVTVQP